jgi:excisionase family DNA binding protein
MVAPDRDTDQLTTTQAARMAQVAPRTVSRWIDDGLLTGHKLPGSRHRRIYWSDLRKFASENGIVLVFNKEGEDATAAVHSS